eukprot:Amastigsp_a4191_29.p2 type:complete len:211 gc:universal Amastigsp_a4191_29:436-1068(+)
MRGPSLFPRPRILARLLLSSALAGCRPNSASLRRRPQRRAKSSTASQTLSRRWPSARCLLSRPRAPRPPRSSFWLRSTRHTTQEPLSVPCSGLRALATKPFFSPFRSRFSRPTICRRSTRPCAQRRRPRRGRSRVSGAPSLTACWRFAQPTALAPVSWQRLWCRRECSPRTPWSSVQRTRPSALMSSSWAQAGRPPGSHTGQSSAQCRAT